jgi:hypothetical protein
VKAVTGLLRSLSFASYERRGGEQAEVVARTATYLDVRGAAYLSVTPADAGSG